MKLKDCGQGKLVTDGDRVGMITGITNNCPVESIDIRRDIERAIPLVQWSDGSTHGIHPANIEIFKG